MGGFSGDCGRVEFRGVVLAREGGGEAGPGKGEGGGGVDRSMDAFEPFPCREFLPITQWKYPV